MDGLEPQELAAVWREMALPSGGDDVDRMNVWLWEAGRGRGVSD